MELIENGNLDKGADDLAFDEYEAFKKWEENPVYPLAKPQFHGYEF